MVKVHELRKRWKLIQDEGNRDPIKAIAGVRNRQYPTHRDYFSASMFTLSLLLSIYMDVCMFVYIFIAHTMCTYITYIRKHINTIHTPRGVITISLNCHGIAIILQEDSLLSEMYCVTLLMYTHTYVSIYWGVSFFVNVILLPQNHEVALEKNFGHEKLYNWILNRIYIFFFFFIERNIKSMIALGKNTKIFRWQKLFLK